MKRMMYCEYCHKELGEIYSSSAAGRAPFEHYYWNCVDCRVVKWTVLVGFSEEGSK